MNRTRLKKIIYSALFCALVFAATWISVPAPLVGNVNLGDSMLLLAAWTLGGPWAVVAAACGSALADLAGAYAVYAPATLVIKALMVTAAILLSRLLAKRSRRAGMILSAVVAELLMIGGYFLYEATFLKLGIGAAANIPFNAIQGTVSVILACASYELIRRAGIHLN